MKEVTSKPKINKKSQNLKRNIGDLYNWKSKKNKENEKLRDHYSTENSQKLHKIQSTKLINSNSEMIASRLRHNGENIEDKLLRDGMRIKQKKLKLIEERMHSELHPRSPRIEMKNKLDYK